QPSPPCLRQCHLLQQFNLRFNSHLVGAGFKPPYPRSRRVGKIAPHERRSSRETERDFAHAVGREDGARVGTARELFSRAKILERRAFAHPTLPYTAPRSAP